MLLTILRRLRDVLLIFVTPILVWLILAVAQGTTSPETTPLSAALVVVVVVGLGALDLVPGYPTSLRAADPNGGALCSGTH